MDMEEYHFLLEKNYKLMYFYAHTYYRDNKSEIGDIVNTIFIRLWEKETINFENENKLKNYIRTSIKNFYYSQNKEAKWLKKQTFLNDPIIDIQQ